MEGIIVKEIQGQFNKYIKIIAENGYCFYDKNNEQINYITEITAPLNELENIDNYIVVQGNAEELNAELEKQRLKEIENGEV